MQKRIQIIAILLISVSNLIAQTDAEKKYFAGIVVDTIKNESVVIIRDYEEYEIGSKQPYDYKINVVFRTQYKIKDLSALNLFSTLYKSKGLKKINITQIKPNGKVKDIYDFEDKEYNENRPEYNIKINEGDEQIAVENLEIGDIIDYRYEYIYTTVNYEYIYKNIYNANAPDQALLKNYNIFKKLPFKLKFLQEKYPSLSSRYAISLTNDLELLYKSTNCDLKFEEQNIGGFSAMVCDVGFMKAYKSEDFSFPYADLPVLKYAVVVKNNKTKGNFYPYQFLNTTNTARDIAAVGRAMYSDKRFMPKYFYYTNTATSKEGYKQASLNSFFSSFIKTFAKDNTDKLDVLNKFHEYIINNDEINTWQFKNMNMAVLLAKFCDKIKQPYKMLACYSKDDGEWENVIHPSELNWGIYIDDDGNDLYIVSDNGSGNIYQKYGRYLGTEAYTFGTKDLLAPETLKYPEVKYTSNMHTIVGEVKLIDEKKNFDYHFNNTYTFTGTQRYNMNDYIEGKFSAASLSTEAPFRGLVNFDRLYTQDIFKDTETFYPEFRRINASFDEQRNERRKNDMLYFLYVEYNFSDIVLDSFSIFNSGEYEDNETSDCGFKAEFKVKDVINESGNNLLVMSLGKLITEQFEISNYKSNERQTNINIASQRQFNWKLNIELPKGFKLLNLEDFNKNFDNLAGSFKSIITQKGNTLTLDVTKTYKTNFLSKDKWLELSDYLKQAVIFYEKKLILEKI